MKAERLYCDRLLDGVEAGMDVCSFDLAARTTATQSETQKCNPQTTTIKCFSVLKSVFRAGLLTPSLLQVSEMAFA